MPRGVKKDAAAKPAEKKSTAAKKSAPKKGAPKKNASKKYLEKVPETMVFWCSDGQVFDDLGQLITGLDLMSEETYIFHANENKNDFSCWILDVIGDEALGIDIKKAGSKTEAKKIAQQRYYDLTTIEG